MTTPQVTNEPAVESPAIAAEPIYVHLAITDPEVLAAVGEYSGPQRSEFVSTCVKIGVLSLRAAKGVMDGDAIRSAGDHLLNQLTERLSAYRTNLEENVTGTLKHYFDPASGLFPVRVESLVKADGELARVIHDRVNTAQQGLEKTLERFLGENSAFLSLLSPTEGNRLLAAMRDVVTEVSVAEKVAIVSQFSLDDPQSALSRLVRELTTNHGELSKALQTQVSTVIAEFSLDRPDSALSRLVGRVEEAQKSISREMSLDTPDSALTRLRKELHDQLDVIGKSQALFQQEVVGMLSSLTARKEAEARSTTHGAVFEEAVGDRLRSFGVPAGDLIEGCGSTTGVVRNSKIGDYLVHLPPDSAAAGARIVVEAKESAAYTPKSTLDEADEARRNRSAGVCLFVHSSKTAPKGLEPLGRYGNDIVVVWDADDPASDMILKAGYLTAKAISMRTAQRSDAEAASFQKIDKAIEGIRKTIGGFDELKTTSETIQNGTVKILERVRIMRAETERQIQILSDQVCGLKDVEAEG